jgi:hypothetical protein
MDTANETDNRTTCPACGHSNIPGASFCARCGQSLNGDAAEVDVIDVGDAADSQSTSVYAPIGPTTTPASTSPTAPASASPWARPDPERVDSGLTSALPIPTAVAPSDEIAPVPAMRPATGARGFALGLIAVLLIAAVIAVYIYAAWLGDSARSTVDGWLPWM